MLCDKEFVTAEKKSAWEENRKLLRTNVTSLAAFGFGDAREKLKIKRMFSFFFIYNYIFLTKKNAEEQLLRYFNYSPNYNDNLVTLS